MTAKPKSNKTPTVCKACDGTDLARRITTYPVMLGGKLEGRQINVGRVALHECQLCGYMMPTTAGQAKVDRLVSECIKMLLSQLPK